MPHEATTPASASTPEATVNGLAAAVPDAEAPLFGAEGGLGSPHGPNGRVSRSELRGALLAECAAAHRAGGAA
ncbi:hypothetical protein ACIQU6_34300 [Streptomyces sp. NPDC090442]|uniref:hypothetical protein n=1 Tax=Streptomyces sp. NPDC090442 TaxID=3365962 RepID=UPI003829FA90